MTAFSIIIPLYNKEKHIKVALNSVLAQTFEDFEVIILNDGSTDGSLMEANSINDERIKLFTIKNQGVSNARNFGVSKANSEIIVFLDADDYWKPNHLEDLKILQQEFPNCGLYATAYNYKFNTKIVTSVYHDIPQQPNWTGIVDDFFKSSIINCIASSSSVMMPKTVFEKLRGFNTNYNSGEDIDLWIRIALHYKVAFTNVVSVIINMNAENQVSQTSINSRKHLEFDTFKKTEETNKSLKKYLDLNRFSIAIQHRLAGNTVKAKEFIRNIEPSNLNTKQRFLLQMNTPILRGFIKIKKILRNNGIGLSAFR